MTPLEGMLAGVGVGIGIMVVRAIYLRMRNGPAAKPKPAKRAKKR